MSRAWPSAGMSADCCPETSDQQRYKVFKYFTNKILFEDFNRFLTV